MKRVLDMIVAPIMMLVAPLFFEGPMDGAEDENGSVCQQ